MTSIQTFTQTNHKPTEDSFVDREIHQYYDFTFVKERRKEGQILLANNDHPIMWYSFTDDTTQMCNSVMESSPKQSKVETIQEHSTVEELA